MPTATDLVTDLPADFEVFGQAVATSMADLLGGTSGQILAKNSNTDMDFVWITNDVGDITAVTAGTGISGGGSSGAVTITNSMATEITAKGDLIVGTGNAAFDNLPAGTNGHVLTADSTVSPTGLKWAAPAAGGKVLQVVSNTYSTSTLIQSTTMTDTGLSATITPTLNTSKILVLVTQNFLSYVASGGRGGAYQIVRGSTAINVIGPGGYEYTFDDSSTTVNGRNFRGTHTVVYMDSPATTSATTYKTQGKVTSTANNSQLQFQDNNTTNSIILMEIGA